VSLRFENRDNDALQIPFGVANFRAPFDLVIHPLRQLPFGDGTEPDIALVNLQGQTVVVYHYSGFGSFTYDPGVPSALPAGTFANSIAAGFELMRNESNLNSVAVDLAVSDSGSNGGGVRILDNDEGTGLFPLPKTQFGDIANNHPLVGDGSMPTRVAAGVLDAFGPQTDFAAVSAIPGSEAIHLFFDGTFNIFGNGLVVETIQETVIPIGMTATDIDIVDVNGDGFNDVVACGSAGVVVVLNIDNLGAFGLPIVSMVGGGDSAAVGDVDGDAIPDMVTTSGFVLAGQGDGTFTFSRTFAGVGAMGDIQLADVDLDGDLDLAVSDLQNNTVVIRLNNGAGAFPMNANGSPVVVGSTPRGLRMADINGDGFIDIAVVNEVSNTVSIIENVTGIFEDLNGDGVVNGGDISVVLNNWGPCPAPPVACPADLSGDGQVDGMDISFILNAWTGSLTAPASMNLNDPSLLSSFDDTPANATGGNALLFQLGFSGPDEYIAWLETLTEDEMRAHISDLIRLILNKKR